MDTPLLALTRSRAGTTIELSPADPTAENMRQLVQLRWIATGGQLLAIVVAIVGLGVPLPAVPMLALVGCLALANLVIALSVKRSVFVPGGLLLALLLDMGVLTAQLYLSGGATNPFISLYLLQVVLGAIILSANAAWLLIGASCLCFAFLSVRHLPLALPSEPWASPAELRLVGDGLSFAMVATLLVLFITRISRNLRARETYLAELRQQTAEEEGVVRMGLFASGAAHELGTPLSSLSVLVADWQRHPAALADPQLQEELQDAQAELKRCKAIVSNILDSAGQTRGEAMGSVPLKALLQDAASAWAAAHPAVPLSYDDQDFGGVKVPAEPALRQAIFNLLDNAAEASPSAVQLSCAIESERVSIFVQDRGPGFSNDQLQNVGKLYHSTKGPGHGLGLFLVSNVARRLGGSLDVRNREGGGASTRLDLPLAARAKGG